jgi:protease I
MAEKPDDMFRVTAQPKSNGRSVLIMTADDTQDLEFFYPYYRFTEEGFTVDVATPAGGEFKGKAGMGLKDTMPIAYVDTKNYDLLYIPGGKAPSKLKDDENAKRVTREFVDAGKAVAALCHGPQVLAAAEVIRGKRIAAWPDVEDEVREAGASYVNEPTVTDGQFITGRWPGDLPSHIARTLEALNSGAAQRRKAS